MGRLLDEDDVVDWLLKRTEMYDATGHFVDENVVKKNIESQIAKIPSAQPEPCDDPRADIYYLAEKIGIHRLYALVVELRGEPEPCEDPISRQQAITALRALSDEDGYINAPHEVVTDVVRGLPPVQAEHEQTTQPEQTKTDKLGVKAGKTYTDTISRKAAIDIIEDFPHGGVWNVESMEEMVYRTKQLPSAPERKTGEWKIREDMYGDTEATCSECGFETVVDQPGNNLHMLSDLHFCPSCGAKMEGEEND